MPRVLFKKNLVTGMKRCPCCHQEKKCDTEYHKQRDGNISWCIPCERRRQRIYRRERRKIPEKVEAERVRGRKRYKDVVRKGIIRRKKLLILSMGGACSVCGYNKNIAALEFDHINPADKITEVSNLLTSQPKWALAVAEAEKCRLVCANCHRERTHQLDDFRLP